MHHMTTTIMASLDSTRDTNAVINYSRHLALQMDAKLLLFQSIYDPSMQKDVYELGEEEREREASVVKTARSELGEAAVALREAGLEVDVSVNWKSPHHAAFKQLAKRTKPVIVVCDRSSFFCFKAISSDTQSDPERFVLDDIPVVYVDQPKIQ